MGTSTGDGVTERTMTGLTEQKITKKKKKLICAIKESSKQISLLFFLTYRPSVPLGPL